MALKDSKVFQLFMQTQVAIFNHMEVKGNNLRSKSSICWIDLFFQNAKSLSQIWIKKSYRESFCPHGNCFNKIDYFWNPCFQVLVFDKWQMKWLQRRKRKLQEEMQKSIVEVVKELQESCSVSLLMRCSKHSTKSPEKCPCKCWDLQQRHIRKLEVLSKTIWEYCNAVFVSSSTFFRQHLFLCGPDSIILIS